MSPSYRALLSGFIAGASLATSAAMFALYPDGDIKGAVVVASPCGIYNLVTVHDDGSVRQYPDAPPAREILEQVDALPESAKIFEIVPCPTMEFSPQYEAQKQNSPEAFEARADSPQGDDAHGA